MRRRVARTAEESELATQLSQYLKMCRRSWDELIRTMNNKSALAVRVLDGDQDRSLLERMAGCDAASEQLNGQIDVLEGEANRLLLALEEPPLRGHTTTRQGCDHGERGLAG